MLASSRRIKKRDEFSHIYHHKQSKANAYMVIYMKKNDCGHARFGFSLSKKVGKAHWEGFRAYDVVVVARKDIVTLDYHALEKEFLKLAERSGIYETSH